jgi:DNA modification methylase
MSTQPSLKIICGDALSELRKLPPESVQCCVTSPPYYGLRDYGTASWTGGNDPSCDHSTPRSRGDDIREHDKQGTSAGSRPNTQLACSRCGAIRQDNQLGLERTPEEYVTRTVEVFREVRRVLRSDATLWLNLGDSHQNKQLLGLPWRVAFALQADGWWLRSDIIWAKPNPMPESVQDRPSRSHEYIFLLSKNAHYFYDAQAIEEPISESYASDTRAHGVLRQRFYPNSKYVEHGMIKLENGEFPSERRTESRNKRSVWTIITQAYPEAHFATFPEELPKICILAGTRPEDTVLDPFAGSGTTGKVALELGRSAILIELNPSYIPLIQNRCSVTLGLGI